MAPRQCPVRWLSAATRVLLQRVAYLERRSGPLGVHLPFAFPTATNSVPVNSHDDLPRYPPGIFTDDSVLSKHAAVLSLPGAFEALQRCDNLLEDLLRNIVDVTLEEQVHVPNLQAQMSVDVIDTEKYAAVHDFL